MVNSGFGANKSILLQRLAYEFQKVGELVFIFNMGDKKLCDGLRSWLPADRYEVTGIASSHPHRLHWNPLQIGRRVDPDNHIDTVIEIVSHAAGDLVPKQHEILSQAVKILYEELSALTSNPNPQYPQWWGLLYPDDRQALDREHQRRGLPPLTDYPTLGELEDWEQQATAVYRSQRASFLRLYQLIDVLQDQNNSGSIDPIEGLKDRIHPLTRRSVDPAQWLRADEEPVPLDTYRDRFPDGGVVIIEGGGLEPHIKSVWFGLAVALLCQDARMRYYTSEDKDPGARQRFTLILNDLDPYPCPHWQRCKEDDILLREPFPKNLYWEISKYGGRVILGRINDDLIPKDLESHLVNLDDPHFSLTQLDFAKSELSLPNTCLSVPDLVDALTLLTETDAQRKERYERQLCSLFR